MHPARESRIENSRKIDGEAVSGRSEVFPAPLPAFNEILGCTWSRVFSSASFAGRDSRVAHSARDVGEDVSITLTDDNENFFAGSLSLSTPAWRYLFPCRSASRVNDDKRGRPSRNARRNSNRIDDNNHRGFPSFDYQFFNHLSTRNAGILVSSESF